MIARFKLHYMDLLRLKKLAEILSEGDNLAVTMKGDYIDLEARAPNEGEVFSQITVTVKDRNAEE